MTSDEAADPHRLLEIAVTVDENALARIRGAAKATDVSPGSLALTALMEAVDEARRFPSWQALAHEYVVSREFSVQEAIWESRHTKGNLILPTTAVQATAIGVAAKGASMSIDEYVSDHGSRHASRIASRVRWGTDIALDAHHTEAMGAAEHMLQKIQPDPRCVAVAYDRTHDVVVVSVATPTDDPGADLISGWPVPRHLMFEGHSPADGGKYAVAIAAASENLTASLTTSVLTKLVGQGGYAFVTGICNKGLAEDRDLERQLPMSDVAFDGMTPTWERLATDMIERAVTLFSPLRLDSRLTWDRTTMTDGVDRLSRVIGGDQPGVVYRSNGFGLGGTA